jgi:hypothetical protein
MLNSNGIMHVRRHDDGQLIFDELLCDEVQKAKTDRLNGACMQKN